MTNLKKDNHDSSGKKQNWALGGQVAKLKGR